MERELFDKLGKEVNIVDLNDNKWSGHVSTFTPRIDNDDNKAEIGLEQGEDLINFKEDDIKSIKEK